MDEDLERLSGMAGGAPWVDDREDAWSEHWLRTINSKFETAHPRDIVHWALEGSGLQEIAIASAFQAEGTAVMHMATRIRPDIRVLFLDTGFHFTQTLDFKRELAERLGLNVIDLRGDFHAPEVQARAFGDRLYERDPDLCCEINKVVPLTRVLRELDAWITAYRRDSSPTRAGAAIIDRYELEPGKMIVKVNPMATWTRERTWQYLAEHDLPHNPLYELGFAQIGCAPCTQVRQPGEPERAGRWAGFAKWECGIHRERAKED